LEKSRRFNERYGAAIRGFREARGLKQSEIQGVTDRHLRRVEHGQQPVTKSLLSALANAHGLALGDYLEKLAKMMTAA
jgi:transcriptional regulator with XRE-family HTH domain